VRRERERDRGGERKRERERESADKILLNSLKAERRKAFINQCLFGL
jgi:hypothetical protein